MKNNLLRTLLSLSENGFLQLTDHKIKSFDTLGLQVRENVKNQLKKFLKQNDKFSYFFSNDLNDVKHFVNTFSNLDSLVNSFGLVYKKASVQKSDLLVNDQQSNQLTGINQCLALFCDRELSLNYFHWLQSQRHRFWRKVNL